VAFLGENADHGRRRVRQRPRALPATIEPRLTTGTKPWAEALVVLSVASPAAFCQSTSNGLDRSVSDSLGETPTSSS
jgi:hypothetical protein